MPCLIQLVVSDMPLPRSDVFILHPALQMLHKSGWVHRDISAGNIITRDEQGRLADFEFAKRASDEDDLDIVRPFLLQEMLRLAHGDTGNRSFQGLRD